MGFYVFHSIVVLLLWDWCNWLCNHVYSAEAVNANLSWFRSGSILIFSQMRSEPTQISRQFELYHVAYATSCQCCQLCSKFLFQFTKTLWKFHLRSHGSHHSRSDEVLYIKFLIQDCSNSIANELELLQSCTQPSTSFIIGWNHSLVIIRVSS